ncbi:MAG: DUF1116 domain-containing protein [Hyphomicrobiaceae bacterium]|nr:MAG: DUF1116 domain-containing protein [Hyphomicrobiaceae bacterium]
MTAESRSLLHQPLSVINVGLESFARELEGEGVPAQHVAWSPPAGGDVELAGLLAGLQSGESGKRIGAANAKAVRRILAGDPVLVDCVPAGSVLAGLKPRMILHAGPPITWDRMCGPMRGAVAGIAVFEGWAKDLAEAERLAGEGAFEFAPNHHFGAVGPMTGMTTLSQPLLVVENQAFGNRAYCAINEGLGKVMRFGGNDAEVLARLAWLRDRLGPALQAALRVGGGVPLKALIARGLSMGDEMHQRNVASSSLLLRAIAPTLGETSKDPVELKRILAFIGGNDQFFLNVAMAMAKALADPAAGIEDSTIVTAMCRNGTDFGIRVSGLGEKWFTAPVEMPEGLYFPGFSAADANPDMGDSAIVETIGLGGFAMGAAPAVVGFIGAGRASDAASFTRAMAEIAPVANAEWTIPAMDYQGVPTGIDIRLVVETGIAPAINTGIAHRRPGVGQVGAGVVRAPRACFEKALRAMGRRLSFS